MVKRALIILALATVHLFTTNLVYGFVYARTSEGIITNKGPTLVDYIAGYAAQVLMFPRSALNLSIPPHSSERWLSLTNWALYLGNSLAWGIVLYSLVALISHYCRRRERKSFQAT
jgi:hypothetical protein